MMRKALETLLAIAGAVAVVVVLVHMAGGPCLIPGSVLCSMGR